MKIKQNRLVIILGTSDFSTSIAGQLNQSQKARGEPEVIAALVAQTNGSLSQVENFLAAHPETKVIVLQARVFKDHLRDTARHFISRRLQVIVIILPTDDQPLKHLEKQYHSLGVSVIGENRANLMALLESTILRLLNPSAVTQRREFARPQPEDHDAGAAPKRLYRRASPQDIPQVQSYVNLLGFDDVDLGNTSSLDLDETAQEPPPPTLPSGSHTERQVHVSWALSSRVPTRTASQQTTAPRKTPTISVSNTSIDAAEATTSDREDTCTLIGRIEHLESEQDQLRRKLEELQEQFTQEQTAIRSALEQAGDALLFAVAALRKIPLTVRPLETTTAPTGLCAPQLEKSTVTPSEGSPATSATLPLSRETPGENRAEDTEEKSQLSRDSIFSPRERELLQILRSNNSNIVHYKELVERFVSQGNIAMLVSKIRARAKNNSLPDPIKTYPGIGLSAQR